MPPVGRSASDLGIAKKKEKTHYVITQPLTIYNHDHRGPSQYYLGPSDHVQTLCSAVEKLVFHAEQL